MIAEPIISVGLYTDGIPLFRKEGDLWYIDNLLIGHGFHWHRAVKAVFHGELSEYTGNEADITLVNRLPLEKYLSSVIGSEMNPAAPVEFLKAHAVISRGWALRMIDRKSDGPASDPNMKISKEGDNYIIRGWEDVGDHCGFDVCSDDHCQRYQGIQENNSALSGIIDSTRGLALLDRDGDVADTRFSKCCGGNTEIFSSCWQDTDYDYLPNIRDPYCDLSNQPGHIAARLLTNAFKDYDAATKDFYKWEVSVEKSEVRRNLKQKFAIDIGDILSAEPMEWGSSGRIITMRVIGDMGEAIVGKELMIRRLFSDTHLYSSAFTLRDDGDSFLLSGQGWGHGVGLCQTGAAVMAEKGADFREILNFYYPHTQLTQLYD